MDGGRTGAGYFGKLPDRADFVIAACPPGFLRLWEPFLTKGLIESRKELGEAWEQAYMTMPVWRFRLDPAGTGSGLDGAVAGAFLPRVDKVGRQFPQTVMSAALSRGASLEQPENDWFSAVEAALLSALSEDASLSGFQDTVSDLSAPDLNEGGMSTDEVRRLKATEETAAAVRSEFWCKAGTQRYAFRCAGLPRAEEFRWLLLPETFDTKENLNTGAGASDGRIHPENYRT